MHYSNYRNKFLKGFFLALYCILIIRFNIGGVISMVTIIVMTKAVNVFLSQY